LAQQYPLDFRLPSAISARIDMGRNCAAEQLQRLRTASKEGTVNILAAVAREVHSGLAHWWPWPPWRAT
jgi:hypothetical protein